MRQHQTINCKGRLLVLQEPLVMGILNLTPDSFYDGGMYTGESEVLRRVEQMLEEGAAIIDIGGMSTRPGAKPIPVDEERMRVVPVVGKVHQVFPEAVLSVDTVRASIAREAVEAGASIVNDVSAGRIDEGMYKTVAGLNTPYVLMHMQGMPASMQESPKYENVTLDILDFLIAETGKLKQAGVKDIIVDPGFGFGKTLSQNYQVLREMEAFRMLEYPLLAGVSRKSMICKALKVDPRNALNGTTAAHLLCLQKGASILRVHDVKEAVEAIRIWKHFERSQLS